MKVQEGTATDATRGTSGGGARRGEDGSGPSGRSWAARLNYLAGTGVAAAVAIMAVSALLLTIVPPAVWQRAALIGAARSPQAAAPAGIAREPARMAAPPMAALPSDAPGGDPQVGAPADAASDVPADAPADTPPQPGPVVAPRAAPARATPEPAAAASRFGWSGKGSAFGASYAATSAWILEYTYDCTGSPGGTGFFQVTVTTAAGASDVSVSQFGHGGSGAGHRYAAGDYTISVSTSCAWRLWSAA